MPSRSQSITVEFRARVGSTSAPQTGDNGNFVLRWVKDGVSSAPTNGPAEVDATNAPGIYKLTLTPTECTCDFGMLCGKSSTAGVVIDPVAVTFEQLPTAAPAASGGLLTYGLGNGQINAGGGRAAADVQLYLGNSPAWDPIHSLPLASVGSYVSGQEPENRTLDATMSAHVSTGTVGAKINSIGPVESWTDVEEQITDQGT